MRTGLGYAICTLGRAAKLLGIVCVTRSGRHPKWLKVFVGDWEVSSQHEAREIVHECAHCGQQMKTLQTRCVDG